MSGPRRYDHDEAYARWQAGDAATDIAADCGVTVQAIYQLVARRNPERRERMNETHRNWQRTEYQKPCVRGCGRTAWHGPERPRVCIDCHRAEVREEAEARDNHGTETRYKLGCRCDECRRAAADAKRQRRERSRVPCSHGCGTLVDSIGRRNPAKPPECPPCAIRRINSVRRERAAA